METSLLLDTSTRFLNLGLIVDGQLIEKISEPANRQQSEITMVRIDELFKRHQLSPKTLKQIVISVGPGSYTGIRIAMTIAKVLGSVAGIEVYTLNSLQIYCGVSSKSRLALLDARSKRAYVAIYQDAKMILEPQIMFLEEIKAMLDFVDEVVGDAHLIEAEAIDIDFVKQMYQLKEQWQIVEDIDHLVPLYLKKSSSYGQNQ